MQFNYNIYGGPREIEYSKYTLENSYEIGYIFALAIVILL